ncbi:MAG: type II toxin-antitoxin system RelE/ParE family toxin [Phenylobacterium sp.]|jgi:hypothetical protein|uniref:type II toxin-antitoxin system RelE/ParE family toxin n=1 Tax=Phenylobacterium sp. TaxID=1871053 RepID=UPI001B7B1D5C|nr:type II toxin-antitoxin system RelE/ParE family toxin [Phenylobacterium sp.]MBP7648491.1 type II toxin-antitoxin system RelE/ParE family toxin [Phenylobacterium sp.]MBP7817021.1 type II toxin-antitoxin system RelE/ParE family toxin [Phenylobacterium sp.]MBP9230447.1 type II toxin-antitoxin system RelE/ParE family toxin [Phenylobacterium sp.]MBP9753501.1 type II toxin-antitoxin system RelE/ParE family toxin [Phenylobacterium sp.]
MTVYMTKAFDRFAGKAALEADTLLQAAAAVAEGRFDADLGGGVFKQRVARPGGGKSGGFRTIILFRIGGHSVFAHGFAKSEKANVSATELKALKRLAEALLGLTPAQVAAAVEGRELIEVVNHGDD